MGTSNFYELFDSKTDKAVYFGTESQCIEYSKQNPTPRFYWVNKDKKESRTNEIEGQINNTQS